jgi:hypothetical protein
VLAAGIAVTAAYGTAGSAAPTEAPVDPASIHVLAIGSCPPWRPKIRVCKHDVQQFAEAARDLIGVTCH